MKQIMPIAEKMRKTATDRADKAKARNRTFKNQGRVKKKFELGQLVAHRQLQLATGSAMGMKPKHNGPYVIVAFDDDQVSATIEHLHTGVQMKAHFTNMSIVNFHPTANRVHSDFDSDLQDMVDLLGNKSTSLSKTRRLVKFPTDPMDDSPTDSVKVDFLKDNSNLDISGITTDLIDLSTDRPNDNATLIDLNFEDSNVNFDMGKLDDDPFSHNQFHWQSSIDRSLIDLPVDQNFDDDTLIDLNLDNSNLNVDIGKLDDDQFSHENFDWRSKIDRKLIDFYDPDDSENIHSSVELKSKLKTFIDLDMDTSVDSNVSSDSNDEQSSENTIRNNSDFSASHSSNFPNKQSNKSTTQKDRKIDKKLKKHSPSHLLDNNDDIESNSTIYISCFHLKDSKDDLNNGQRKTDFPCFQTDLISFDD
jgi:hypothetical protein